MFSRHIIDMRCYPVPRVWTVASCVDLISTVSICDIPIIRQVRGEARTAYCQPHSTATHAGRHIVFELENMGFHNVRIA